MPTTTFLRSLLLALLFVTPSIAQNDLKSCYKTTGLAIIESDADAKNTIKAGLLGLVMASIIAAYMSTISTHLNWGSSYVTHDVYRRFLRRNASERELVMVGRLVQESRVTVDS